MKLVRPISATLLLFSLSLGLFAVQRGGYQGYGRQQYYYGPNVPSEFYWTRLQYNSSYAGGGELRPPLWRLRRLDAGLSQGRQRLPDRPAPPDPHQLSFAAERQPISIAITSSTTLGSTPSMSNTWTFTDEEAKRLHDYLLKGGFLMVDDFHGTDDWEHFMAGMRMVLPDRPVEDLKDSDEIYHVLYDINEKFQIPSEVITSTPAEPMRRMATCPSGAPSATTTAASWWPSAPTCISATPGSGRTAREYPEKFSGLAFRIVLNYITYSMTH